MGKKRIEHFKHIAFKAALKSGELISRRLGNIKSISYKGEINLVTDIDRQSEKIIIGLIKSSFSDHAVLSEEKGALDTGSPYKWIIDPLDGTTNYAHGFPFFCVSIALEYKGAPVFGVVYDPERKELFHAEKTEGAFLNRKNIHVSKTRKIKQAMIATGFAYNVRVNVNDNLDNFARFLKRAQAVRRAGSAALDMCYVACARFDGFWESDLHPWDTAAASVIVKEAGGMVTKFDGTAFSLYGDETLASNTLLHKEMVGVLKK